MASFQHFAICIFFVLLCRQSLAFIAYPAATAIHLRETSTHQSLESQDENPDSPEKSLESHSHSDGSRSSEENFLSPLVPFGKPSAGFFHASVAAISVILVSEVGDKTFFIAVILAMKHSRIFVFCGAMTALALMTVLSAVLGQVTTLVPRIYVHYVSVALFVIFGLKMIKEGYSMPTNERSEYDEAHKSIQNRESKLGADANGSIESGAAQVRKKSFLLLWIFLEAFTMTFLAEWGDRSQLTTIVLAARENVYGVIFGAVVGHAACTLLAVVGGRIVADRISVKAVTIIGGVVFLAFAVWALCIGPGEETTVNISNIFSKSSEVLSGAYVTSAS